jgi:hypothetical protein
MAGAAGTEFFLGDVQQLGQIDFALMFTEQMSSDEIFG